MKRSDNHSDTKTISTPPDGDSDEFALRLLREASIAAPLSSSQKEQMLKEMREHIESMKHIATVFLNYRIDNDSDIFNILLMDKVSKFSSAADFLCDIYPKEIVFRHLGHLAEEAKHKTAERAPAKLMHESESPQPSLPQSKVQAVFGDIPPDFLTKRHSKRTIPEDALHDPEVIQTAKDIVNANRRTKIEALEPAAREKLRTARKIVRVNRGPSSN
ncbi:MAG TPA: hypothetical protein VHW66_22120 [Stellaceae bacterium]|jgi:hypothetical protein|nr:hypothetical protein [Stellaceae bacterium]